MRLMNDIQRAEMLKSHIEECRNRIGTINNFMETNKDSDEDNCCRNIMRLKTVISALEELQQYQGLCKPKEIEHFKSLARIIRRHGTISKALDACAEYEKLGTLEEVRAAVKADHSSPEEKYSIEQIIDAITQADKELIEAIRYQDAEMIQDILKDYL